MQLKFIALQNNEQHFPVLDLPVFHCEPCAAYFVTYLVFIEVLYVYSQAVGNSTIILATAMWNTGTKIHCSAGRMRNVNWGCHKRFPNPAEKKSEILSESLPSGVYENLK